MEGDRLSIDDLLHCRCLVVVAKYAKDGTQGCEILLRKANDGPLG
jgi:hypothetical protein